MMQKERVVDLQADGKLQEEFPSIELAYPIAVESYNRAERRFDAWDGRIQTLIVFAASIGLAVPPLIHSQQATFRSAWFISALCLFVLSILIGFAARMYGSIKLLDPNELYEAWLDK